MLAFRSPAKERGQSVTAVLAEAIALLDSVADIEGPDIEEDRRRLREFEQTGMGIPLDEIKAWVESWGTPDKLPRLLPRKIL